MLSAPVCVCVCVQGDREKQLGMAVSPLMDRKNKGGITRSQVGSPCCLLLALCCMTVSGQRLMSHACTSGEGSSGPQAQQHELLTR